MFTDLKEYIETFSKSLRQSHLDLSQGCIEIGGDSRLCRGLMAHHLNTTMDYRLAHVCHACNNAKCSNPKHLYWGTPRENWEDAKECGRWKSVYSRTITKYGTDWKHPGNRSNHTTLDDETIKSRLHDASSETGRGRLQRLARKWGVSHTQVKRFLDKYENGCVGQLVGPADS